MRISQGILIKIRLKFQEIKQFIKKQANIKFLHNKISFNDDKHAYILISQYLFWKDFIKAWENIF